MVTVLYTRFREKLEEEVWDSLIHAVPATIQERIARYRRWQDRHSRLLGALLLREALSAYGYGRDCLEYVTSDEYGRPFLDSDVDFNISHSGEYVVCAISNQGKVGIDIENIRPLDLDGFQSHMSVGEWKAIEEAPDKYRAFYRCWTMKESVTKAEGKGLSIPLVDVFLEEGKAWLYGTSWYIREIMINPFYCCHLATASRVFDLSVRESGVRNWTRCDRERR